jgi:hypothetical protein
MLATRPSIRRLFKLGAVGAAAAAATNVALFAAGRAADVVFWVAEPGTEHAQLVAFDIAFLTLASFAVGILAAAAAIGLRRPSLRVMQIIGGVIAVVSCWADVFIPATAPAKALLVATHLVVGVAYVATLQRVRTDTVAASVNETVSPYAIAA